MTSISVVGWQQMHPSCDAAVLLIFVRSVQSIDELGGIVQRQVSTLLLQRMHRTCMLCSRCFAHCVAM